MSTKAGQMPIVAALLLVAGCATPFNGLERTDEGTTPTPAEIRARLVLIGDAGDPRGPSTVLDALADTVENLPGRTWVAFLGDNVYPDGVPPEGSAGHAEADSMLALQVRAVVATGGEAILIPGNHDWRHGLRGLVAQADTVRGLGARYAPDPPGCPGPTLIREVPGVSLVALDTEWLLSEDRADTPCAEVTEDEVYRALADSVASASGSDLIVLAHHPLRTRGRHGGACGFLCLRRLWKVIRPDPQDMGHPANERMRRAIADAIRPARPLIFAAGHDHSLQLFQGDPTDEARFFVVSGRGSPGKESEVGHDGATLYAREVPGFMIVDFLDRDRVLLRIVETDSGAVWYHWLR